MCACVSASVCARVRARAFVVCICVYACVYVRAFCFSGKSGLSRQNSAGAPTGNKSQDVIQILSSSSSSSSSSIHLNVESSVVFPHKDLGQLPQFAGEDIYLYRFKFVMNLFVVVIVFTLTSSLPSFSITKTCDWNVPLGGPYRRGWVGGVRDN